MAVAYFVSRFPKTSETFIVRELDQMAALGAEVNAICSLYRGDPPLHRRTAGWLGRVERPGALQALGAVAYWMARRPLRVLGLTGRTLIATARRPGLALRSVATIGLALAHARRLRGSDTTHLHAHFATYPALAAWICASLNDSSFSLTAHAHDIFIDRRLLKLVAPDAEFIATISEFNRRLIGDEIGSLTPIHLIRCGIDPAQWQFSASKPTPQSGPIRALCVAGLRPYKGHRVLFEALVAPAASARGRIELDLVGAGPLESSLQALAKSLGIADRVNFCGAKSESEVVEMLGRADLFVLAATIAPDGQMDGLPVALIEALACGVPSVATTVAAIDELIEDGRTGYLATPGDPDSLAGAIERALAADRVLDSAAGRAKVEAEFTIEANTRRLLRLFPAQRATR